jgi:hypothetical protein
LSDDASEYEFEENDEDIFVEDVDDDDNDDNDVIYEDIGPGSETHDDICDQPDLEEQSKNGWTQGVVYNINDLQERRVVNEYEHVRFGRDENSTDLLTHGGTRFDTERHRLGGFICSAHPLIHLTRSPLRGYIRHDAFNNDMNLGILRAGRLITTVSASHTGSRAIIASWAFPSVKVVDAVQHVWKNQQQALVESDGMVAICFIPINVEGDNRVNQYINFPRNCPWARSMHPVYSLTDVPVTAEDFMVFNISNGVPIQLKDAYESKYMVPLRTIEQKRESRRTYLAKRLQAYASSKQKKATDWTEDERKAVVHFNAKRTYDAKRALAWKTAQQKDPKDRTPLERHMSDRRNRVLASRHRNDARKKKARDSSRKAHDSAMSKHCLERTEDDVAAIDAETDRKKKMIDSPAELKKKIEREAYIIAKTKNQSERTPEDRAIIRKRTCTVPDCNREKRNPNGGLCYFHGPSCRKCGSKRVYVGKVGLCKHCR